MSDPLEDNINRTVKRSDLQFEYEDSSGDAHNYPVVGQGPATLASPEDLARDALGFTNPNLHRRVEPHDPPTAEDPRNQEVAPRGYQLNIQGVHSYRTTTINVHNEDSIYDETP
jgi:hypothetical protein